MGKLAKIPSRPPVYKEIYASLCRRAGKPELALKQYTELGRSGSDPKIYRKQAFALAKSGKELEAIPIMEELLKLNPKDFYIHNAYIPACKRVQQLAKALAFYEKLLEANPEEKPLFGWIKKLKKLMEAS
jgi:tetratricopeptide (TPR) repeat protein